MTKEEKLNKISEEILQLERNRRRESLFYGNHFITSAASSSSFISIIITMICSGTMLALKGGIVFFKSLWEISIDQFIIWISFGFITIVVILIVASFIYRSWAKKGNIVIDTQIENLKSRYLQVKNDS